MMLMIYNVSSTIFHVAYISVQCIKSDTILVSNSLDCRMHSFVQTHLSRLGLWGRAVHILSLLPHVALFVFSSRSIYDFV